MGLIHLHSQWSRFCPTITLVVIGLWAATGASAQKIDGLSTAWIGGRDVGEKGQLAVSWDGTPGAELTAWFDFDGDGIFDEASERVFEGAVLEKGIEIFEVSLPARAAIDEHTRMRLSLRTGDEVVRQQGVHNILREKGTTDCEWASGFHSRGMSSTVYASAVFDDGNGPALYVGGSFITTDDVITNRIAKWDGETWTPLGTGLNGDVRALAVYDDGTGSALYVGGKFTTASGVSMQYITKWDGTAWIPLGTGTNRYVYAFAVYDDGSGSALYAAGDFSNAGGVDVGNIAKWDGTAWTPLGTGTDYRIAALAVYDDGSGPALFAAGVFSTAGGVDVNQIAKWDGAEWTALATSIPTHHGLYALTVYDDGNGPALYVGGRLGTAGGIAVNNIAKWDGSSWSPLSIGVTDYVTVLTVYDDGSGSALYAGGYFTGAGGVTANKIAKWNGAVWRPLGTGMNYAVHTIAIYDDGTGSALYAGGEFTTAGGKAAGGIAKWDSGAWTLPSGVVDGSGITGQTDESQEWLRFAGSEINAFAVYDDGGGPALYAGGIFTVAGGVLTNNIAKWNGTAWTPLGSGTDGAVDINEAVYALTVHDDGSGPALYAGGRFTSAGGVSANRVAKWDGTMWTPLGAGVNSDVDDLVSYNDGSGPALYAAGDLFFADGLSANRIAKWDGVTWTPLGVGVNSPITALAVYDDGSGPALYAGGGFTTAGGISATGIAKWDGMTWAPVGTGVSGRVSVLKTYDDGNGLALYAAGVFGTAGGVNATHIAKWDGAVWTPVGPGISNQVQTLTVYDDGSGPALYAGSDPTYYPFLTEVISKWDGVAWAPLASGLTGKITVLMAYDDGSGSALYAGGEFTNIDGVIPSSHIAKWACTPALSPDLAITKTNGTNQTTAGGATTYTIIATNPSPIDAPSARLIDEFPSGLTCSWTSSKTGGASGNTAGSGPSLEDILSMPAGSSVTYTVTCDLSPSAIGELRNTAKISAAGDANLADNIAVDTDVIVQESDLSVTLSNGIDEVIVGGTVTYSLFVTNHGPSDAAAATLTDNFPAELTDCRWHSLAVDLASGHTSGAGAALSDSLAIPVGNSVSYIVTCGFPTSASETLTHTATVTASTDPDPTNNSASDTDSVITRPIIKTLILTHFLRMQTQMDLSAEELEALLERLHAFADHRNVQGLVLDVGHATDLAELYTLWDADVADGFSEPALANRVLFGCHSPFCGAEKQGLHDILRERLASHSETRYLMLVGDDRIFPMARMQDLTDFPSERDYTPYGNFTPGLTATNTTVGQALARYRYLSDDPLASRGAVDAEDLDRPRAFFLPDLAVARLVETPDEIRHSLDVFLGQDGFLDLTGLDPDHRVLVTGYDFLIDSGEKIRQRWKNVFDEPLPHDTADLSPVDGQLLSRTWDLTTAAERGDVLLDHLSGRGLGRYGIINLNGHATHYEEGVPGVSVTDIQGLSTADLDTLDLTGSVIYAVGCHGGLPVAGSGVTADDHPLDLPQTFLRRGAMAYAANSGFGWGLLDAVGYSERMVEIFTEELSQGGDVTIADAILTTKERYFLEDPNFDLYDLKISMQWTLFGFPMITIRTGISTSTRDAEDDGVKVNSRQLPSIEGVALPNHLVSIEKNFDLTASGLFTKNCPMSADGEPAGCYYALNELSTGEGDLPIEPFFIEDSLLPGRSQHGVLWKGASYEEEADWTPVFAQLVSNIGPIPITSSLPRKTFIRPRGRSRRGSLSNPLDCRPTDTDLNSLVVTPAELFLDEQPDLNVHRLHRQVDLEVFYFNNTEDGVGNCDRVGPRFDDEDFHNVVDGTVHWSVSASDDDGEVWRVVVVYDDEVNDRWVPLDLAYDVSSGRWQGEFTVPQEMNDLTYFLQAVDNRGNVSWAEFAPLEPPASGIDLELPLLLEATIGPGDSIFADGFETSDCSKWSHCP